MKLRDIKIERQLKISLGVIFLFVVILGATAWYQSELIWQQTQGLYDHPFAVRSAIGNLKVDVLTINAELKDLALTRDDHVAQTLYQSMALNEADANLQFSILRDRYLGPSTDIDEAYSAFIKWKTVRDQISQFVQNGKADEATNLVSLMGLNGTTVENILSQINDISSFAGNKADQFMTDAQKQNANLVNQLVILLILILGLGALISYFLIQGITTPLRDLTSVALNFGKGKLDARSQYSSKNEFGQLASTFNNLAESIQIEFQSKEKVANIADVLVREEDLSVFCQQLLKVLMANTDSQVGAAYLLNAEKTEFNCIESIGLSSPRATFSATIREGEFGSALISKKIQHISQIPEDTRFTFSAVVGDLLPHEIITIPIISGNEVVGMISLANIRKYSEAAIRVVNDIWSILTARFNSVLFSQQIRSYSEMLGSQNWELAQQAKELSVQADELSEQNIELEIQKKALDEASRLKSAFLSNMSHELRTPLNSIIALTEVLRRRLNHQIPVDEYSYLEVIERNGKNLLTLINDILDLSRVEAGREEINLSSFSITELISDVVEMIDPQARRKNIEILTDVDQDIPPIVSDYSKCHHILQNIVGNAVKFTEVGTVKISAFQDTNFFHLTVSDTGIGIPYDYQPYIFDEFRQADESTSRKYEGTGLGLAIVKKYTALLHGTIYFESVPEKGTTFTLQLPKVLDEFENPPAQRLGGTLSSDRESPGISNKGGQGKKILIVEDNEPAIIQLNDILLAQGYSIQIAHNGREALDIVSKSLPDAMILDLMMPEVDGFEVLRMVRGENTTSQLPVLILTAKQITKAELAFLKGNHIQQLIQKGDINKKDLLTHIANLFESRPVLKENPLPSRKKRARTSEKPVILIVEDNSDNRKTVDALLKHTYELIEAVDGLSGIDCAKTITPDLILLDISLPKMDGFQVLDELRNGETTKHIPILALTARAMKGDRERILTYGFDGYISKPIDAEVLLKVIDEMIYE